jgi:hypothetical protein
MTKLEEQIAAYRAVPFDEKGEAWDKVRTIEEMEEQIGDRRVLAFFLGIVSDPAEYDMARCHLLKWFEGDPAQHTEGHRRIGECIASALAKEEDWLVKSWLARAADAYHDVPAIARVSAERLLDRQEHEEVRCGCLQVLERLGPTKDVLVAFGAVADSDDAVAEHVRRVLREWGCT